MRRLLAATLCLLTVAGSASAADRDVVVAGGEPAPLVLRFIRLAEAGSEAEFRGMTARTAAHEDDGTPLGPPDMDEVDRSDEGCVLHSVQLFIGDERMGLVEAFWNCREDYRHNAERMFIVENGRITQMWNHWAEPPLAQPPESAE